MAKQFNLPDLGENVEQAEVISVLVSTGDVIQQNDNVIEVETDKATVEVPCTIAGRVVDLHINEGDTVKVGDPVLSVEESEEVETHAGEQETESAEEAPPADEDEATETEEAGEAEETAETEAESAPAEEEPDADGEPSTASTAKETAQAKETSTETAPARRREPAERTERRPPPAGPATRRFARQLGVDLYQVSGSGPGGRITREDVQEHVKKLSQSAMAGGQAFQGAPPLPDFSQWGEIEREPLKGIRRATAEAMSLSWQMVPRVTQFDETDITELESARKRYQENSDVKITVTVLALKAAVAALKQFPQVNASLDPGAGVLIKKKYYHIGVAVDTEHGLLVPVIRDVDRKSVRELAVELQDVAEKARNRKLSAADMQGGTFTITNLGGIGGTNFTPIVNYPEVAILGLARGQRQPVYNDAGQLEPRLILPLSFVYDHRVVDGADGARFVRTIARLLSNPMALLLEG